MAFSSEVEQEKVGEYVSMKFLLKQVYAAHTTKVKELEHEVEKLKQELDKAKNSPVDCIKCKELQSAYSVCKEEYKNSVLVQTKRLNELEKLFSSHGRKEEIMQKTQSTDNNELKFNIGDSLSILDSENFALQKDNTCVPVNSNLRDTNYYPDRVLELATLDLLRETSPFAAQPNKSCNFTNAFMNKEKTKNQPVVETSVNVSQNDEVLVPSTLDITCCETSPAISSTPDLIDKMKNIKVDSNRSLPKDDKENQKHTASTTSGKDNPEKQKISQKRGLSDITASTVQHSNKRHSSEKNNISSVLSVRNENGQTIKATTKSTMVIEQLSVCTDSVETKTKKLEKNPASWAENFKDFNYESLITEHHSPSIINDKANGKIPLLKDQVVLLSDDDFEVNAADDNGTWKSCVKKNVKKKPSLKSIKSTSRFKLTLDAPSLDFKKPSYKQTKLSKSIFHSASTSTKNNKTSTNTISQTSSSSNNKRPANKSSAKSTTALGVSDLASFTDFDETFVPGSFGNSNVPMIEVDSPTCPLMPDKDKDLTLLEDDIPKFQDDLSEDDDLKDTPVNSKENNSPPCDSFDRVPTADEPNYKYKDDPVRDKSSRKQLQAFNCKECENYYSDLGLPEDEKKKRLKQCSRHRAKHVPPATPDNYWELSFPDTAECKARGYMGETQMVQLQPRRRRQLI